jgi:hypothetical protein
MEPELQLPDWLSKRLAEGPSLPRGVSVLGGETPAIGDLFVITGGMGPGVKRVGVVVGIEASLEVVQCALLTNETEYASDWDVRLTAEELKLPYALMVECDIVSSVWWKQLGQRLGTLALSLAHGIVAAASGDFSGIDESRRGTPIHGPADPRWGFREHELSALQTLSAECTSRLIDGLILDPSLLAAIGQVEPSTQREIVAALCDQAARETVTIEAGSLGLLSSTLDSIDPDAWNAMQPLMESASDLPFENRSVFHSPLLSESFILRRPPAALKAFESLFRSLAEQRVSIAHLLTSNDVWGATNDVFCVQSDDGWQFTLVPAMLR